MKGKMNVRRLFAYFCAIYFPIYFAWSHFAPYWVNSVLVLDAAFIFSWILASLIDEAVNRKRISPHNKIVLITGCDSGFGHELAKRLHSYGFHVFAGVLHVNGEGANKLKSIASLRLTVLKLDVTSTEDVEKVMNQIRESQMPLWAVVNNAGIGMGCPFDWGHDVDEFRKVFEVNVFGLVRVTKCFIPLLRQSRGRLVNVSSLAARLTVPQMSHYSMAKSSVRAFSDAVRREPVNRKVKVITIEPAAYKTAIIDYDMIKRSRRLIYQQTPEEIRAFYGEEHFEEVLEGARNINRRARPDLGEVIDAMEQAITRVNPKLTYWCCSWFDSLGLQLLLCLPEIVIDLFLKFERKRFCSV